MTYFGIAYWADSDVVEIGFCAAAHGKRMSTSVPESLVRKNIFFNGNWLYVYVLCGKEKRRNEESYHKKNLTGKNILVRTIYQVFHRT